MVLHPEDITQSFRKPGLPVFHPGSQFCHSGERNAVILCPVQQDLLILKTDHQIFRLWLLIVKFIFQFSEGKILHHGISSLLFHFLYYTI